MLKILYLGKYVIIQQGKFKNKNFSDLIFCISVSEIILLVERF